VQGFEVTSDHLTALASRVNELASRIEAECSGIRSECANASAAAGNGVAGGAIDGASGPWVTVLQTLADKLRQDAKDLHAVASLYTHVEGQAKGQLTQILQGLES
jgi:uncharacterized protein YukE